MFNKNLANIIVLIIAVILIGYSFYMQFAFFNTRSTTSNENTIKLPAEVYNTSNTSENNMLENKVVEDSNSNYIDTISTNLSESDDEVFNLLSIDEKFGEVSQIYNSAIKKLIKSESVVFSGDVGGNFFKFYDVVNFANGTSHLIRNYGRPLEINYYILYKDGVCYKFINEKNLDGTTEWKVLTDDTLSEAEERIYVADGSILFPFENERLLLQNKAEDKYNYILEDNEYTINNQKCYKINHTYKDSSYGSFHRSIYISKDTNLIIKIELFSSEEYPVEYNISYGTDSVQMPEYVVNYFEN